MIAPIIQTEWDYTHPAERLAAYTATLDRCGLRRDPEFGLRVKRGLAIQRAISARSPIRAAGQAFPHPRGPVSPSRAPAARTYSGDNP